MPRNIIVAYDSKRGIGAKGSIPWKLPLDMKRFKDITSGLENSNTKCVVMGRKTWDSIPKKFKPLPDRYNIIISTTISTDDLPDKTYVCRSFDEVDTLLFKLINIELDDVFYIGGAEIYKTAMQRYEIDTYYITEIYKKYECDTYFPTFSLNEYSNTSSIIHQDNDLTYKFIDYKKKSIDSVVCHNQAEYQYFELAKNILTNGIYRDDRTGVGTLSIFDYKLVFDDIDKEFPLLTSKRVFWRGVSSELVDLFLKGKSSAKILQDKDVKIWDGNSSREYLDKIGQPHREVGDLGPFYGFQWKHWGAKYIDCHQDYKGQGIDQIQSVVDQIKNNPTSRRIIISAWNVTEILNMCLPPCHVLYQFYVDETQRTLSCIMYQRSADVFLGLPFNIASTALLTTLIAKTCDLTPKKITIQIGDAHIYLNHIKQVQEQITRTPFRFPKLQIKNKKDNVSDYDSDDLILTDYKCHGRLKAEMAA